MSVAASTPIYAVGVSVGGSVLLNWLGRKKGDAARVIAGAAAVSTPGSPQYRHYLPVAAIARRFGASLGTQTQVVGYLGRIGATDVSASPSGLFVKATMSVALAERTFGTSLASFQTASGVRPAPQPPVSSGLHWGTEG